MKSLLSRIWPELLAFALGLGLTWLESWRTADLVWCLWLSSLVLGYLTILATIAGGVIVGYRAITHPEFPQQHKKSVIIGGVLIALFFIIFFSFHFCGFHSGHATFLLSFFPVGLIPRGAFAHSFMNPLLLWQTTFHHLMPIYGWFLIPAVIAERKNIFKAIYQARKVMLPDASQQDLLKLATQKNRKQLSDPFMRPYINVIRMHLLIFFFAGCHAFKIESFWIFVVVYAVYFFPWKVIGEQTC